MSGFLLRIFHMTFAEIGKLSHGIVENSELHKRQTTEPIAAKSLQDSVKLQQDCSWHSFRLTSCSIHINLFSYASIKNIETIRSFPKTSILIYTKRIILLKWMSAAQPQRCKSLSTLRLVSRWHVSCKFTRRALCRMFGIRWISGL